MNEPGLVGAHTGAAPGPLRSVTRRIDPEALAPLALLAVAGETGLLWSQPDIGFAGRGTATTIDVARNDPAAAAHEVSRALGAIEVALDEVQAPGSGPIALGALPFDPRRHGTLTVPEHLVVAAGAEAWITRISSDGAEPDLHALLPTGTDAASWGHTAAVAEPGSGSSGFRVSSDRDPSAWCDSLTAARDELVFGPARKVVLARAVTVESDQVFSRRALLESLARAYPACMLFADGPFIGASPELLVARDHDTVHSQPMAGTAPRSNDPDEDTRLAADLLASTKNQTEHRYTIDVVHDTLLPWCSYLDEDAEPRIVAMANVQHLATRLEGRLSAPPASVIELMTALHPTPAVGGAPRDAALEMIDRFEHLDRDRYAGPVGWVDAAGNGAWAVGIRSALVEGHQARVFAGVGVVADSDPAAELAETRSKLQAVLGALIRP